MITAEQWDAHWWRIYDQLVDEVDDDQAARTADRECAEQFGPEPKETQT